MMTGARNESALSTNAHPGSSTAMMTPAIAGPRTNVISPSVALTLLAGPSSVSLRTSEGM